jgi:hypothetical protein
MSLGFIGNSSAYAELLDWLRLDISSTYPKLNKDCICLITGGSGVGKTYGTLHAIENANKTVRAINKDECTNSKELKELILKHTRSNVLQQFEQLQKSEKKECIIFVDDIETLLAVDRSFINNLNTLTNSGEVKCVRIIATCNLSELKVITKSMMYGKLITLETPKESAIDSFLNEIIMPSNLKHKTLLYEISNQCEGNLSTALNMASIRLNTSATSGQQTDLFPEVAKIYNMTSRNELRSIVEQDPWLHPLRFHENIIHEFKIRRGNKSAKEQTYISILTSLCEWDQHMSHSKGYDLGVGIEMACNSMLKLLPFPKFKNAEPSMDEFTRMFNYLSLRKKNILNMYEGEFPWHTVGSFYKKLNDARVRKEQKLAKSRIKKLSM